MDNFTLSKILEHNAHILACMARVEGMKAANKVKELQNEYPSYYEDDFNREADTIETFANYLRESVQG